MRTAESWWAQLKQPNANVAIVCIPDIRAIQADALNVDELLLGFSKHWGNLARKGKVSSMEGTEFCMLECFVDYIKERQA